MTTLKTDIKVKIKNDVALIMQDRKIFNVRKVGKKLKGTLADGREVVKEGKDWFLILK